MSNEERMAFTSQPKGRGFSTTNTVNFYTLLAPLDFRRKKACSLIGEQHGI
ncbi:MAG: hypothetical protein NTY20_02900 [Candidatus Aenigmarchaeota archaeon]|nr:hypothetical protein [Candidatus Aenigmarchaeota archaeon]